MESDSGSESSGTPPFENKGRKRLRCVERWVKNKKIKKDSGKAYTTYRGERRGCKQPAIALSCHCQHHCSSHMTMEDRQRIFKDFYQLGSHDTQNKYLYGLMERSVPRQRRRRRSTGKPRANTYRYFVRNVKGERIQVCKETFCQLHALIINIWFVGILTSPTTETSPRSRRGKPVLRSISLRIGRRSCASPVPLNHFTFRK